MTYPATLDAFPAVLQDGSSVVSEAHTIPASPAYTVRLGSLAPAGWQLVIPDGAFPLVAPAAPTLTGQAGGALTPSVTYKYVVVFGTQYGETVAGSEASIAMGTNNAVAISGIPTGGTVTNPVLYRKVFRTAAGGASGTEKQIAFIDDNTTTEIVDILADADLPIGTPALVNGSGQQLVTVPGYTEVAASPAAGQFVVDYGLTTTGGLLTFNAANAGAAITVSYTGGTLVNASLLNSLLTSTNLVESTLGVNPQGSAATVGARILALEAQKGAASGLASLTASTKLVAAQRALQFNLVTTTPTTLSATDEYVLIGGNASGIALTLPAASAMKTGQVLVIQNGANVTVPTTITAAGADKINGLSSYTLGAVPFTSITLVTDAGNWYVGPSSGTVGGLISAGGVTLTNCSGFSWVVPGTDRRGQFQVTVTTGGINAVVTIPFAVAYTAQPVAVVSQVQLASPVTVACVASTAALTVTIIGGSTSQGVGAGYIVLP